MADLQDAVPFTISAEALATDPADSDRFVFTPTFVVYDPYAEADTARLPRHQIERAGFFAAVLIRDESVKAQLLRRYEDLESTIDNLEELRKLLQPREHQEGRPRSASYTASAAPFDLLGGEIERAVHEITESLEGGSPGIVGEIVARVAATAAAATAAASEGAVHAATPVVTTTTTTAPQGGATVQPPPGGTPLPGGGPPGLTRVPSEEHLLAILQSELGLLFLDRTRVRPIGFALGEHVYSLSLGPGEEVTVEERTYSKKEESFETSSELEKTFDTELASTLTTELTEGMNSERSSNTTNANTMGANVGGNIYGVTFNIGPTWSSNVTDGDRTATTESLKNSQVASAKVAARNRSQHKTVFKVATESRFEMTNKRVLRNPNTTTPIDLQYFKVLQRLQLSHERYGLRLCWAPAVPDPGAKLWVRLERVKRDIYARAAAAGAGPRPEQPVPRQAAQAPTPRVVSASVVADRFDPVWGNQRHDYRVNINAPQGMVWDRKAGDVVNSLVFQFTGSRPAGAFVDFVLPTPTGVLVVVHVGIEDNANPFKPQFWEARGNASFTVSARFEPEAAPVAPTDDSYAKAMDAWREALAAWEAADREAKAEAKRQADEEWAAYLKDALRKTNPRHEVVSAIVQLFPTQYRDELVEIDFWEDVFDWKNAGLRLYPSWWSSSELRDPNAAPNDFVNASWARLYLPIRPGAEARALRWIYDRKMSGKGSQATETLIATIEAELEQYRRNRFGSPNELQVGTATEGCPPVTEQFVCLGRWEETLPTDGTHLEVMQATSSAADDYVRKQMADADRLRNERIDLVEKAVADGLGEISTSINLDVGTDETPTSS
jgi:hypothetical protein